MIIQITEDRQVGGRWFLAPQQYAIVSRFEAPVSLCSSCTKKYDSQNITFYEVSVDGVSYNLPFDICSLISGDTPSSDMRGFQARWDDKVTHDITLKEGEHTDVVKQARKYLDIHMTNRVQVDGNRLRDLLALKEKKGHVSGCQGDETSQLTEQQIELAVQQAGGNVIGEPTIATTTNYILQEDANLIYSELLEPFIQEN